MLVEAGELRITKLLVEQTPFTPQAATGRVNSVLILQDLQI